MSILERVYCTIKGFTWNICILFFQLLHSLRSLIKNALFQGSTQPAEVLALFPGEFMWIENNKVEEMFADYLLTH